MLPEEVEGLEGQNVMSIILAMQNGTPVYNVNATETSNFLWLIPLTYEVQTTVDAQTGDVESISVPWWAKLFFGK